MTQNPYDNATSGGYAPGQVPGQRLVAMEEEPEEKMIEAALRPKSLDDFVGQSACVSSFLSCSKPQKCVGAVPTMCCFPASRAGQNHPGNDYCR